MGGAFAQPKTVSKTAVALRFCQAFNVQLTNSGADRLGAFIRFGHDDELRCGRVIRDFPQLDLMGEEAKVCICDLVQLAR